jgi:hypothetical protein
MVVYSNHASATDLAVVNAGLADAGPFRVSVQLGSATYYFSMPGLAAGAALPIGFSPPKNGNAVGIITVTVDCDITIEAKNGAVSESDETDNVATFNFIG